MTRNVCWRLTSSLVLLTVVSVQLPTSVVAQSVARASTTPALTERLDRLAAEVDRNRIDFHVPGAGVMLRQDSMGFRDEIGRKRQADRRGGLPVEM